MNLFPGHIVYDSENTYEILSFKNRENANVRNLETGEKKKAKETFDFVLKTAGKHSFLGEQIDNSTHTELFFDEIHQCYNCQLLMQNILVECRKFQLTPTLALHYLDQLTPKCKKSVLASGSSYLLLQGCDVKAFKELSTYFEKDGYSEIDLAELDRYNALCLIKNEEQGYSSFICKLPS